MEGDQITLQESEPPELPGPNPLLNLSLAVINLFLSFKNNVLFYFSKCVQSIGIKKVIADTSERIIPETPLGALLDGAWLGEMKTLSRVRT